MVVAMESVEKGLSGVNQAALQHGVPKTTLKNRLSGRVAHGIKPEPRPYLDKSEEKELSDFLQRCSSMDLGKHGDILKLMQVVRK